MKVAVITPYHIDNSLLYECLLSVRLQTYESIVHIIVGDGCESDGFSEFDGVHNITLPSNLADYGSSPRSIGVVYAKALGVDAITFLDSDNWFDKNHIKNMINASLKGNSLVVACQRNICHLDGSIMGVCPHSNGVLFSDTNCIFVRKEMFEHAGSWWLIPDALHSMGDRIVWDRLIHATDKITLLDDVTVNYRSAFQGHYSMFGFPIPQGVKLGEDILLQHDEMDRMIKRSVKRFQALNMLEVVT